MCFYVALFFSLAVCSPVDVKNDHNGSNSILVGDLAIPRFVLTGPSNFAIIRKLSLIPRFELLLKYLLLALDGRVFVVASPIVEVVIVKPEGP